MAVDNFTYTLKIEEGVFPIQNVLLHVIIIREVKLIRSEIERSGLCLLIGEIGDRMFWTVAFV